MKICKKCLNPKDESEFGVDKSKKDGLSIYCKDCQKLNSKKYKGKYDHKEYYEKYKDKRKEYYQENKESRKEYGKQYYSDNIKKIKEYREENKDKRKEKYKGKYKYPSKPRNLTDEQKLKKKLYDKEYKQIHKDRYNQKRRVYKKLKKQNDPLYKLKEACRTTIYMSIKRNGYKKESKSHEILGCSYEDFKNHIESQFENWMNWNNYGLCNNEFNYGWDIDHIVPCASAKTEEELLKLNHYTNLRPLCSHINRNIKRDRLDF